MTRTTWENVPSVATPLSAAMLNDLEARKPEVDYQAINVRNFPGGSLGQQLTNAIAALPTTGATLLIPRGKYDGTFSISGVDNLRIVGEGGGSVLHNTTASVDALLITDCEDLEVRGIRVQGTSGTRDGLSLIRCDRARIGSIYCSGTGRIGIRAEECLGLVVDPCYAGSALTLGPYPTGVSALTTGLQLTWDTVNVDSGCNGFVINGGFYVSGQSQSWAVEIDHSEVGVINAVVPELSGGGLHLTTCDHITINGYYGEANPSDIEYTAGTASVTNALTSVTGASTAWATNDAQGHPNAWANKYLVRDNGTVVNWQRIAAAPTDTSITLSANWGGPTEAAVAYRIISFDLLLESCHDCNVTQGRGAGAVALKNSIRNKFTTLTDSLYIDATSTDNRFDVATNHASGSTGRIIDRGVRNYIHQTNYQTGLEVRAGTNARFGDVSPAFFVDSGIQASHTSGYAVVVGNDGALTQWPTYLLHGNGQVEIGAGGGSGPDVTTGRTKSATFSVITGDLAVDTAGKGLQIKEGTNAKMGTSVLVGGTVTVSTTAVTANSRIFLTCQLLGGTAGALRVTSRTAGTSFVITSTSGTDTSTVAWMLVEPT